MIGLANAGITLLSIHGFGFDVERIVVDNLFCLVGRDSVAGEVIAISIVPLKSEIRIQASL